MSTKPLKSLAWYPGMICYSNAHFRLHSIRKYSMGAPKVKVKNFMVLAIVPSNCPTGAPGSYWDVLIATPNHIGWVIEISNEAMSTKSCMITG